MKMSAARILIIPRIRSGRRGREQESRRGGLPQTLRGEEFCHRRSEIVGRTFSKPTHAEV